MTNYTAKLASLSEHDSVGCLTVSNEITVYTVRLTSLGEHDTVGCFVIFNTTNQAKLKSIGSHDATNCLFTLGITLNAQINNVVAVDLVYSVIADQTELILDGATVEWVAIDSEGVQVITHSTDDYSVITFGNTMVVHLDQADLEFSELLNYSATIAAADENTYSMSGEIVVSIFKTVERLYGILQNPEPRVYGRLQNPAIRVIGTLQNPETRVYGTLQNPVSRLYGEVTTEVRVYGTLQNPEPRVYGTLRNPESKVCGILQNPTTRLYGMLQEVEC